MCRRLLPAGERCARDHTALEMDGARDPDPCGRGDCGIGPGSGDGPESRQWSSAEVRRPYRLGGCWHLAKLACNERLHESDTAIGRWPGI